MGSIEFEESNKAYCRNNQTTTKLNEIWTYRIIPEQIIHYMIKFKFWYVRTSSIDKKAIDIFGSRMIQYNIVPFLKH